MDRRGEPKVAEVYFKPMREEYLEELAEIYNYYALNTTITFHNHALCVEKLREMLFFEDSRFCSFGIFFKHSDDLIGWIALKPFNKREVYNATAEIAMYIHREYVHTGIGTQAMQFIEKYAQTHDFHVLLTVICYENEPSIKFMEHMGYYKGAYYHQVGRKFNRWLDLVSYEKIIENSYSDENLTNKVLVAMKSNHKQYLTLNYSYAQ